MSIIYGSFECPIQDSSFLLANFTNVLETKREDLVGRLATY